MLKNQHGELRAILAELYPDAADLRRVAHDAGVALDRVTLGSSAINNWDGLLQEAAKNQQIADLLDVAQQEYGRNQPLAIAAAAFLRTAPTIAVPLPDNNLHLLNFGRALTAGQQGQIEARLGERIHRVLSLEVQLDDARPVGAQCVALIHEIGWSASQWETTPLLVNPPGYAPAALALVSLLHGHRGYFPALVRLRPEVTATGMHFVLAEIVNLQALRNGARAA